MATQESKIKAGGVVDHLSAALERLKELKGMSPDIVDEFLDSLESPAELASIHGEGRAAEGANELIMTFEPSERLRAFLAAHTAGKDDPGILQEAG